MKQWKPSIIAIALFLPICIVAPISKKLYERRTMLLSAPCDARLYCNPHPFKA